MERNWPAGRPSKRCKLRAVLQLWTVMLVHWHLSEVVAEPLSSKQGEALSTKPKGLVKLLERDNIKIGLDKSRAGKDASKDAGALAPAQSLIQDFNDIAVGQQMSMHAEISKQCYDWGLDGECAAELECWCYCYQTAGRKIDFHAAYYGEFGYELQIHIPYLYYMYLNGHLRKTVSAVGTRPLYFFAREHTEAGHRHVCMNGGHTHPKVHTLDFNFREWVPPPYKLVYKNDVLKFEKPLLIIHNKYNVEWDDEPVNFINKPTLKRLVKMLRGKYTIVYIRHVSGVAISGFSDEMDIYKDLNEYQLLKRYHGVILFNDLYDQYKRTYSYNRLQMMLHANCDRFISVQGGNSVVASYFGGINIVYAVKGWEVRLNEYTYFYPRFSNATVRWVNNYRNLISTAARMFL